MPAWLIKLGIKLIPPDKALKIIFGCFFGILLFFSLLFAAPIIVYKHIPLGKKHDEFSYYMKASKRIESETGVFVHWQKIMAIDAVLLEQDFSGSSESRAYGYKEYFIREEQEYVEQTCTRTITKTDEKGNEIQVTEEYDCSYWITVYYERPYDEVLQLLVKDGKLAADLIEDVKRYTIYDATPVANEGQVVIPDGWVPVIREYLWPIENIFRITSTFGTRVDPFTLEVSTHNGIDIGAPTGTPVLAVGDGKVLSAQYMGSAGNAVVIQHDGNLETRYYHLSSISVRKGAQVKKGDKIGEVGSTGRSTGPHLHLEFRISDFHVDPLQFYR